MARGRPHGEGVYVYFTKARYEGGFVNGKYEGKDVLTNSNGLKVVATFADGDPVGDVEIFYTDGGRYSGGYKNGARDGEGKMRYNDHAVYEGTWKNGQRDGDGYLPYPDGTRYEGAFVRNLPEGRGIRINPNGNRYEGDFKSNLFDGQGIMVYALGGCYEGGWKAGKYDGKGVIVYAGGRRIEGQFKDGAELTVTTATAASSAAPTPRPRYALKPKDNNAGIMKRPELVSGSLLPFDKTYQQLSAEQKQAFKSFYPLMDEADEPPYPLGGMQSIGKPIALAQQNLSFTGIIRMQVHIDSEGNAESVTVLGSPDADMSKVVMTVLMRQKYKPALCDGKPCAMIFPYASSFDVR
ncbi:MAG TPA: hypothetical protein DCW29_07790 [Janthinobacterium sp.]|nr:hypothetical protein [Janthinobacterium sp.]